MIKLHLAVGLGAIALLSGCASSDLASTRAEAAYALQAPTAEDRGNMASNRGLAAWSWGDINTSTLLLERAVQADPSPLNKFNLAAAYQTAGRSDEARALYDQVSREGQMVYATTVSPERDRTARNVRFNLADMASLRSAVIQARTPVMAMSPEGASSNVSATVPMSPAEALAADARANPN